MYAALTFSGNIVALLCSLTMGSPEEAYSSFGRTFRELGKKLRMKQVLGARQRCPPILVDRQLTLQQLVPLVSQQNINITWGLAEERRTLQTPCAPHLSTKQQHHLETGRRETHPSTVFAPRLSTKHCHHSKWNSSKSIQTATCSSISRTTAASSCKYSRIGKVDFTQR